MTIDAAPAGAGADSYADPDRADAYFNNDFEFSGQWAALSLTERESLLV